VGESALARSARCELVTGAHAHERSSWRHFSTRDRVEFLERAERDPVVGLKLRLRLARWRRVGFALFAIVASIPSSSSSRAPWQHDWLVVDLRLGQFERAAERAGQRGVEPELAALARLAAEVPAEARDAGALEQRALETLVAGDEARAANYLELARLRGQTDLDPVIDAVEALPRPAAADVPPPWDAVLEARRRVPRGPLKSLRRNAASPASLPGCVLASLRLLRVLLRIRVVGAPSQPAFREGSRLTPHFFSGSKSYPAAAERRPRNSP
jgi:hypothetical protein